MYTALIVIHVIICIILIATILLQAGRGGGLTEAFGGSDAAQSMLGTQAPAILKKATEVSAIAFLVTSLALGVVTARRGRSLFEGATVPVIPQQAAQAASERMPAEVAEPNIPLTETNAPETEEAPSTAAE